MENQAFKSTSTIQRKMSSISINFDEHKFRKVLFEQNFDDLSISPSFVYKAAMQGCTHVNQKILKIHEYGVDTTSYLKAPFVNKASIQEPKRIYAKIVPTIQKVYPKSPKRSKSQHQKFNNNKSRVFQGPRGKTMTLTRFSNKTQQPKTLISSENSQKQTKSIFKNTNSLELSRFKQKGQNFIRKSVQKKVRLKTNSVTSLSSELTLQQKHNKCIPLKKSWPSQQLEESFLQNAYRLRKCEVPVWYQVSRLWGKAEQKEKFTKSRIVQTIKQNKKIIYEGYDFNGQLIPSTNIPQKGKKPLQQNSQINIQFFNEDCVENLSNYHERQQRYSKTYNQMKINSFDCDDEESEFLANLQRVPWARNVEYKKREHKAQNVNEKTKKSINFSHQHQKITQIEDEKQSDSKDCSSHDLIQTQEAKISDKEQLLENFDRIRYGHPTAQVNENNNFPFGLSKYVKVKKFQEKHTKSKSYNFHTVNYFSYPFKDSQPEIATTLKLKPQSQKSDEKVRANKRLFKQVFDMSLRRIDPQNREDILTAKLIKDREKQNAEQSKNQRDENNLKKHCGRHSDTLLLKKGFSMKPTLFKKIKQNEVDQKTQVIDNQRKSKNPNSKKQNLQKTNQTQAPNQAKIYEAKTLHQSITDSKVALHNYRKSIGDPRLSLYSQNIQKVFKKQTKTTLIKQSAQDYRRQSYV